MDSVWIKGDVMLPQPPDNDEDNDLLETFTEQSDYAAPSVQEISNYNTWISTPIRDLVAAEFPYTTFVIEELFNEQSKQTDSGASLMSPPKKIKEKRISSSSCADSHAMPSGSKNEFTDSPSEMKIPTEKKRSSSFPPRVFLCDHKNCNRKFLSRVDIEEHHRLTGHKCIRYRCYGCSQTYQYMYQLNRHIVRCLKVCGNVRDIFMCCNRVFTLRDNLIKHKINVHDAAANTYFTNSVDKKDEVLIGSIFFAK